MNTLKRYVGAIFLLLGLLLPSIGNGQLTVSTTVSRTNATIGEDRNGGFNSEAYRHNISPPSAPCGISNPNLLSISATVSVTGINAGNANCAGFEVYGNLYRANCSLAAGTKCGVRYGLFGNGCTFSPTTRTGTFTKNVNTCGANFNYGEAISIDIVPSSNAASCITGGANAISNGWVEVDYSITITWTIEAGACDDGDPCTTNDRIDSNCNCRGDEVDCSSTRSENCNDGDPCTTNDRRRVRTCDGEVCVPCAGTFRDSDRDGICDAEDDCDNRTEGDACNDRDSCTTNDRLDANCNCVGTFLDSDRDGVCDEDDVCPGSNDNRDRDGDGIPNGCDPCDNRDEGEACDDGDACTTGDVFDSECNCVGTFEDEDNDGVCDADDACPGFNDNRDSDGDGIPNDCDSCDNRTDGTTCDDGDACTTGDVFDSGCNCAGTFTDTDGDGVCDANDICPGFDDNLDSDGDGIPDDCETCEAELIGTPCDDEDPCTTEDTFDGECNCIGAFLDTDGDGVCDANDICEGSDDGEDIDGDGIPDGCDSCDNRMTGTSCDDNDSCTINDVFDMDCGCVGTFADMDGDGVCDAEDICEGSDDGEDVDSDGIPDGCDSCDNRLIGTVCDDGDACTVGDIYDMDCGCIGTFADADGDGVCDAEDICPDSDDGEDIDGDGIPDGCDACDNSIIGTACDDGKACTSNDVFDSECNCVGDFADADGDGVCDTEDICEGSDDAIDADSDGLPDGCDACDDRLIGTACDDGDACTVGDVYDMGCNCIGDFADADGDGVCDAEDICEGSDDSIDVDSDGLPDGCDACDDRLIGTACDDGDACTVDDTYDMGCNCVGTFADADGDGVCDAEDLCPDFDDDEDIDLDGLPDGCDACDDRLIGTACDDGDACTVSDEYDMGCNCIGDFADADGDGVCDAEDICEGSDDAIDVDGDGLPDGCDACDDRLIGTACDDGDVCTVDDTYDMSCNCVGIFADADGDAVCDAEDLCPDFDDAKDIDLDGLPDGCDACDDRLIGTVCDDGDACTVGDEYDMSCNCVGTFADADGDGVCDAEDICEGSNDAIDEDSDGLPDGCDTCDDRLIGTACDDGDVCTVGDEYDIGCNCAGTFADSDSDGVCDAEDLCPDFDDSVDIDSDGLPDNCDPCDDRTIGNPCDDNDECTINDMIDNDCGCTGTFADADGDGVCDAEDICQGVSDDLMGQPCDDDNPCTIDDSYDGVCNCVGVQVDCATGLLIRRSCDDNDPSTKNDEEVLLECNGEICRPCAGIPDNSRIGFYYIPNVFSPNDDNLNDHFSITFDDSIASIDLLEIYDRWGNIIYSIRNMSIENFGEGWDGRIKGKNAPTGVYLYILQVSKNGEPPISESGSVTLLR